MGLPIVIVFFIGGVLLALAIGALLLKAGCSLAKEEVPGLGHAMGIVFITGILQAIVSGGVNVAFDIPVFEDPRQVQVDENTLITAGLTGFAVNTVLLILLYRIMIPTSSLGKAALVWLIQLLIVLVIGVALFVLLMAAGLGSGGP